MKKHSLTISTLSAGILLGVIVVGLLGWGAWALMAKVPANAARVWALLATLAIPLTIYITRQVTALEVRGQLKGIDQGVGTVTRAAAGITRVRTSAQQQQMPTSIPPPALPQIESRYTLVEKHTNVIDV